MTDPKFTDIYRSPKKPGRFERKPESDRLPSRPVQIAVGGRIFSAMDMIGIRRKLALRQPLDPDEQAALEQWNAG